MNIELGCKKNRTNGFVALNKKKYLEDKEIVADFEKGLPLENNSIDIFVAMDILHIINDFIFMMKEIHRVCKKNSKVVIRVPFAGSYESYSPEAKKLFHIRTFIYFDPKSNFYYEELPKFKLLHSEYGVNSSINVELEVIKDE